MQKMLVKKGKPQKPRIQRFKPDSSEKEDRIEIIFRNQEKEYARILGKGRRLGRLRPCEPDLIRKLDDLKYIGGPFNAPKWITPQYIADCMENKALQKEWSPKRGDWYLDADFSSLFKIRSRKEYGNPYAPPHGVNLEKARTENGRWLWHYYLPEPAKAEREKLYICMCARELTDEEMKDIAVGLKCWVEPIAKVLNQERWDYKIGGKVLIDHDKAVLRGYGLEIIMGD